MSKQAITTPTAPAAIGPYSQAIRSGNLLFVAGQIPIDPATGQIVPGGIAPQTTRVLENLKAILKAAGSSPAQVLKTTVFLKDFNDFMIMNSAYSTVFETDGVPPPARSTIEVSRLPKDALIEIELIAEV